MFLIQNNNNPLILIDDMCSELDDNKANLILKILLDIDTQVLITDTRLNSVLADNKLNKIFTIKDGQIAHKY